MYCGICGAPIESGARFCPRCGAPAGAVQNPTGMVEPGVAPPPMVHPPTRKSSTSTAMVILIGVVAVLGVIILMLAGLLFFGDRLRGTPATTASATATTIVADLPSPTNPIATAIVAIPPSPAVAPSPTLVPTAPPTLAPRVTVAPTTPPKPTVAPATATPAAPPVVSIAQMGIRVSPPAGWQRQDDIAGSKNGTVSFYQPGPDKRSYHFNRNGLFVIGRWPLTMGAVPAEDYLMGFEDGMVMEFATLIGSGPDVTDEPLRKVQIAGRSGQTTTVTIRNSSTTLRYLWWDLSTPTEALNIFCGAEDSQWQRVRPLCNQTIQSLSLTN